MILTLFAKKKTKKKWSRKSNKKKGGKRKDGDAIKSISKKRNIYRNNFEYMNAENE